MSESKTISGSKYDNNVVFLISATILTLFLFYIDEGYYNFDWMKNIGNWIVFFPYVGFLLAIQMLYSFTLGKINKKLTAPVVVIPIFIVSLFLIVVTTFR